MRSPALVLLEGMFFHWTVVEEVNRHATLCADLEIARAAETLALERGEPYFHNVCDEFTGRHWSK